MIHFNLCIVCIVVPPRYNWNIDESDVKHHTQTCIVVFSIRVVPLLIIYCDLQLDILFSSYTDI